MFRFVFNVKGGAVDPMQPEIKLVQTTFYVDLGTKINRIIFQ